MTGQPHNKRKKDTRRTPRDCSESSVGTPSLVSRVLGDQHLVSSARHLGTGVLTLYVIPIRSEADKIGHGWVARSLRMDVQGEVNIHIVNVNTEKSQKGIKKKSSLSVPSPTLLLSFQHRNLNRSLAHRTTPRYIHKPRINACFL